MAVSLDQAVRLTELGKITITRAIKCSWLSASRKAGGVAYEIDPVEPEPAERRANALIPWRAARLAHQRADEELRHRLALSEERLTDLKAALEDMRAQRRMAGDGASADTTRARILYIAVGVAAVSRMNAKRPTKA